MNVFEDAANKYIDERKKLFENMHGMKMGDFLNVNNNLAIAFQKDICVLLNIPHDLNVMMLYSIELKKWFAENKEKWMPDNEAMKKIASNFYKNLIKRRKNGIPKNNDWRTRNY